VYKRNTELLESLTVEGLVKEAAHIAAHLRRSSISPNNLRFFGAGDATLKALALAFYLGLEGCRAWGFSKKPEMVLELKHWCDSTSIRSFVRPHFLLSVDRWTTPEQVEARIQAGVALNRVDKVLAYMALKDETPASIRAKPFWKRVRTVLGYHATAVHTVLSMGRECPKTAQKGVSCQECRRCMRSR
jgi:hypothetical protein